MQAVLSHCIKTTIRGRWRRFRATEKTELAMKSEGLTKLTKNRSRTLSEDAESDSVDSLICACGSSMLMTFSTLMGLTIEDDDLRWKMAYIQNDGKELN